MDIAVGGHKYLRVSVIPIIGPNNGDYAYDNALLPQVVSTQLSFDKRCSKLDKNSQLLIGISHIWVQRIS